MIVEILGVKRVTREQRRCLIIDMHNRGMTPKEIIRGLGVDSTVVRYELKAMRLRTLNHNNDRNMSELNDVEC